MTRYLEGDLCQAMIFKLAMDSEEPAFLWILKNQPSARFSAEFCKFPSSSNKHIENIFGDLSLLPFWVWVGLLVQRFPIPNHECTFILRKLKMGASEQFT